MLLWALKPGPTGPGQKLRAKKEVEDEGEPLSDSALAAFEPQPRGQPSLPNGQAAAAGAGAGEEGGAEGAGAGIVVETGVAFAVPGGAAVGSGSAAGTGTETGAMGEGDDAEDTPPEP